MSAPERSRQSKRQFCERHREWYVPFTGPGDPNGVPCPGCVTEAEAHWREAEDNNIRTALEMPGITCLGYHCGNGCELIACEGPAEPGWTWVEEHGWVCPDCIGRWPSV